MKRLLYLAQQAVMVMAISMGLFVVINLLAAYFYSPPKAEDHIEDYLQQLILPEAYATDSLIAGIDSLYIRQNLLNVMQQSENQLGEYGYYPGGVEYLYQPFKSEHLNVTTSYFNLPYRHTAADTLAPYHIYCFGGSTTYGLFVNDRHTWPAWLQQLLNEPDSAGRYAVFNFGVSGFSPTQETALFHELLKHGHRPSLVIFMDGVNTGPIYDASEYAAGIAQRFGYTGPKPADLWTLLQQLPVVQLFKPYEPNRTYEGRTDEVFPVEYSTRYSTILANRFTANAQQRQWLGQQCGVPVVQFWQPSTYVEYNRNWLTTGARKAINDTVRANYRAITRQVLSTDSSYINLVLLFARYGKPAVVDGLHYSPEFNLFIARHIYEQMKNDSLPHYYFDSKQSTGVVFPMTETE